MMDIVQSVDCGKYSVLCCGLLGGAEWADDSNRLDKLIMKAGSVIGRKPYTSEAVLERRSLNWLLSIMDSSDHTTYWPGLSN